MKKKGTPVCRDRWQQWKRPPLTAAEGSVLNSGAAARQLGAADRRTDCGRVLVFLQPAAVSRGPQWQHKAQNWLPELAVQWGGWSAVRLTSLKYCVLYSSSSSSSWHSLYPLPRKKFEGREERLLLLWSSLSPSSFFFLFLSFFLFLFFFCYSSRYALISLLLFPQRMVEEIAVLQRRWSASSGAVKLQSFCKSCCTNSLQVQSCSLWHEVALYSRVLPVSGTGPALANPTLCIWEWHIKTLLWGKSSSSLNSLYWFYCLIRLRRIRERKGENNMQRVSDNTNILMGTSKPRVGQIHLYWHALPLLWSTLQFPFVSFYASILSPTHPAVLSLPPPSCCPIKTGMMSFFL